MDNFAKRLRELQRDTHPFDCPLCELPMTSKERSVFSVCTNCELDGFDRIMDEIEADANNLTGTKNGSA